MMTPSDKPNFNDVISFVAQLVPDIPEPSKIMYEIKHKDKILWLEGWCDGCIASEGFPPKGEGMLQEKLDHIAKITPGLLSERAKKREMKVQYSGFMPVDDKKFLYGISWAIFIE